MTNSADLSRRRILSGTTGVVTVVLAGCVFDSTDDPRTENGDENGDTTSTENGEANGDDHVTAPDIGGALPDARVPPPDGVPEHCPDYDNVESVICYDGIDSEVPAYLDPTSRTLASDDSIEFSLHNVSDATLETNFNDWLVHKYVDGDWWPIPVGHVQPLMMLSPGDHHTWTVTVDNSGIEDGGTIERFGGSQDVELRGYGGGAYAFRGRGWFEHESHESAQAFAITFSIDADPLTLTPTSAIENIEWDGETLLAAASHDDSDSDRSQQETYELRRVDEPAEEPREMIVEQVLGDPRLRDTLALATEHDADVVRLEEYPDTLTIGSIRDPVVRFRGDTYEIEEL